MSSDSYEQDNALVALLRIIAGRSPEPWFYQQHARQTGASASALVEVAEWLYLEGLVQKAPGSAETGPGLTLTEFGREVTNDPALLEKLRRGESLRERDVGASVRQSLLKDTYPVMTRIIIGLNVMVFLYGAWLASQRNVFNVYLGGFSNDPRYLDLMLQLGAANTTDILNGEWWRLLASTFLHSGMLHIGMNMFAMNSLGRFAEQTWGSWRLGVIYLVAAWTGSCFAASNAAAFYTVGASGAICGVMGAEGAWVALYGRYLPRGFTRRFRSQFLVNVIFLTFISLMPGISWQGHLGGAVGGAVAALLLHFHRFGGVALRWLSLLALPLLGWGSYAAMLHYAGKTEQGQGVLTDRFNREYARPARDLASELLKTCVSELNELLDQNPARRDPNKVEETLTKVKTIRENLIAHQEKVRQSSDHDAKAATEELITASVALCDAVIEYLNKGENAKAADERLIVNRFADVDELEANLRRKMSGLSEK